ncbi:MAG: AAA family ATPase [Deltaproteobacteria bacterium]|nr:AAA family ATPase [Deltaproteobacteria bacterium]
MKKIIAVSGKGGIGKSSLSALITRVFSDRADHKILLVDADPSINLTLMLGLNANKTLNNLRERFVKSAEAAQAWLSIADYYESSRLALDARC